MYLVLNRGDLEYSPPHWNEQVGQKRCLFHTSQPQNGQSFKEKEKIGGLICWVTLSTISPRVTNKTFSCWPRKK